MEMMPSKDYTPSLHEVVEIRTDEDNTMKLYEAALRGCKATLNSLVQKDPLILNKVSLTSFSETPLHISALLGHLDFTKALLNQKPKLTTELDSLKCSPLHLASAEGHIEIVKALLHANNDVCLVHDLDGRIPLHLAVMRGRIEVIQELISARPESIRVHLNGDTVLHLCVRYNHLEALKLLVTLVDDDFLNSRNQEGNTILHSAVMLKQLDTIRFLFSTSEVKAKANALNGIGFTTLDIIEHSPRDFKSLEIRDILMKGGVRSAMDLNNFTPSSPLTVKPTKSRFGNWIDNLANYGKWLPDVQGDLMLVATVIATVSFQAVLSPPGGVLPDCRKEQNDYQNGYQYSCEVGMPTLAYSNPDGYDTFLLFNSLSFVGSLIVILLSISGFPRKNKFVMWLLTMAMGTTVIFMTLTFLQIVFLTPLPVYRYGQFETPFYACLGLLLVVLLNHGLRLVAWLVRLPRVIKPKVKSLISWVMKKTHVVFK